MKPSTSYSSPGAADRKRTSPSLPPAPKKKTKNEWLCVARIMSGSDVSLELFSPDGTLRPQRSFNLSVEREGKKYSVTLKDKEVKWFVGVLRMPVGTQILKLFNERSVEVAFMSEVIRVTVKDGETERKVFLDVQRGGAIASAFEKMLEATSFPFEEQSKKDLFMSLALLKKRYPEKMRNGADVMLAKVVNANAKNLEAWAEEGERLAEMGNPRKVLVDLMDRVGELLPMLVGCDDVDLEGVYE